MQTGRRNLRIFQDRDDIEWGQVWMDRIDKSLDAATFLIPMLTPSFFLSEQCRRELDRFLEREEKIDRNALIFPIYWVRTPRLENASQRDSDNLAKVMTTRQYADWRSFRIRSSSNLAYRRAVVALAEIIVKALGGD